MALFSSPEKNQSVVLNPFYMLGLGNFDRETVAILNDPEIPSEVREAMLNSIGEIRSLATTRFS